MANANLPNFTFGTYAPKQKENPYREIVEKLAEVKDESAVVEFDIPKEDALKVRLWLGSAANEIGKTAKMRANAVPVKDANGKVTGMVHMAFSIVKRHGSKNSKVASETNSDMAETSENSEA